MQKATQMTATKRLVLTAVNIALCLVLPMAFHSIPNGGKIMLPMHIPVLLCGMVCGAPYGAVCGLLGPMLSSVLTGMPTAALMPAMMVECAAYGLTTGLMLRLVRTGKTYADLYLSLVAAILVGRLVSGVERPGACALRSRPRASSRRCRASCSSSPSCRASFTISCARD